MTIATTADTTTGLENASQALLRLMAAAMAKLNRQGRRPKKAGKLHRV